MRSYLEIRVYDEGNGFEVTIDESKITYDLSQEATDIEIELKNERV